MKALMIVDWQKHYENNRSRELKRPEWWPCPNSFDGTKFMDLLDHPAGMSHYGAWCLLLGAASRQPVRGFLVTDSKTPMTTKDIARMTRGSARVFDEALPRFLALGWVREVEIDQGVVLDRAPDSAEGEDASGNHGAGIPQEGATSLRLKGKGNMNEKGNVNCEAHARDEHDLGAPAGEVPPAADADRWGYVRTQSWSKALIAAGCKIGPQNWPAWQALVESHTQKRVVEVARTCPATDRWPDRTETALLKSGGQAPIAQAVKHRIRSIE